MGIIGGLLTNVLGGLLGGSKDGGSGGGGLSSLLKAVDFSQSEVSSADAHSGVVELYGEMGKTGEINFPSKLKTNDYLIIAGGLFLLFLVVK